jgi:large subunit ribosomal protein L15
MPLYRRIARRGFTNYPFKKNYQIVNVGDLDRKYNDGETVDKDSLKAKGLIRGSSLPVKVLGDGELNVSLNVNVDKVSKSAAEKIKAKNGEIVTGKEEGNTEDSKE